MLIKKYLFFFILLTLIFITTIFTKTLNENKKALTKNEITKNNKQIKSNSNSNLIKNVEYIAKDQKGNEYLIKAETGEIDLKNKNIIFLTKINALIKLNPSGIVKISSNFGKYNILNNDTIFNKRVVLTYDEKEINAEYLDLSTQRSLILFSKNVIYKDKNNILYADAINMNLLTKELKIFMDGSQKKIKVNSLK